MNNSIRLLERVRLTTPNKSKEQLAKKVGIDPANLRRMYRELGFPNPVHCLEIAAILKMDARSVLAYVAADKARSEEAREAVKKYLPRILPTLGFAIALAVGASNKGEKIARICASGECANSLVYTLCEILAGLTRKFFCVSPSLNTGLRPVPA